MDHVLAHLDSVPLELVRDLLDAETRFAQEAWGVHMGVSALAQTVLTRGRTTYLDDYIDAMGRGMDAYCACRRISLPEDVTAELIDACRQRVEQEQDPRVRRYHVLLKALDGSKEKE